MDVYAVESIRKRPGMYLGWAGPAGLQYLPREILANSLAEARAGFCRHIRVDLLADGGCRVSDDGRGIPVHSPGPRRDDVHRVYVNGWAAHKALSIVAALSRRLHVEVSREGQTWRREFSRGVESAPLAALGPAEATGSAVTFWPDGEIFGEGVGIDWDQLVEVARRFCFLTPGVRIELTDERPRNPQRLTLYAPGGLVDYLEEWIAARGEDCIHPTVIRGSTQTADGRASVAFRWLRGNGTELTFANAYQILEGGTHLRGFRSGLTESINAILRERQAIMEHNTPTGDVVNWGVAVILTVDLPDPRFDGARRLALNNPEATDLVHSLTRDCVEAFFLEHPDEGARILDHVLASRPVDPKTGLPDRVWRCRPET